MNPASGVDCAARSTLPVILHAIEELPAWKQRERKFPQTRFDAEAALKVAKQVFDIEW